MKNKIYLAIALVVAVFHLDSCKKTGGQDIAVITDVDGYQYKTLKIGTQTWMTSNLQTKHYADGTAIGNGALYNNLGSNDSLALYFAFDNDTINLANYGRLYTWAAISKGADGSSANPSGIQGPCPNGWHVPSEAEFATLINYLGGQATAGGPMKGNALWEGGNAGAGNNVSGFNALPGGERLQIGTFQGQYGQCYFWTATDSSSAIAYMKVLNNTSTAVTDSTSPKNFAFSCRCVQN